MALELQGRGYWNCHREVMDRSTPPLQCRYQMDSNDINDVEGKFSAPGQAMEFLSRSWSVSSSKVIQPLSPSVTTGNQTNPSPIIAYMDQRKETLEEVNQKAQTDYALEGQQPMLRRCLCRKWFPGNISSKLKVLLQGASIRRHVKDFTGKRKEEIRLQRAQVHAAISVAGVAAAIAALSATNIIGVESPHRALNVTITSAAALVTAHCVEVAEAMGADHQQVSSVLSSAITAKTAADILTLTAAAATSLRAAATLKSRPRKRAPGLQKAILIPKALWRTIHQVKTMIQISPTSKRCL